MINDAEHDFGSDFVSGAESLVAPVETEGLSWSGAVTSTFRQYSLRRDRGQKE